MAQQAAANKMIASESSLLQDRLVGPCSVVFGAHADDIALSLGCHISEGKIAHPIVAVTVFSISSWAKPNKKNNQKYVTEIRSAEDRLFANLEGLLLVELGLLDAFDRIKFQDMSNIFRSSNASDEETIHYLSIKIDNLLNEVTASQCYFPLGIGGHLDHNLLSLVGQRLEERNRYESLYYADQPYFSIEYENVTPPSYSNFSTRSIVRLNNKKGRLSTKRRHCEIYNSQPAAQRVLGYLNQHQVFNEVLYAKNY